MFAFETNPLNFIHRAVDSYEHHSESLNFGIKEKCVWNQLENFHVYYNIYCDLMHDVLEGVFRYDFAFLVNDLIKKRYFDLNHLNNRIKYFKFSKADVGNAMPCIKLEYLKKKYLCMSSSEMLSFSLYFGILVGDLVPETDNSWTFYKIIRELIEVLLSRSFTSDRIEQLGSLIEEHHNLFLTLFNEPLKPKYHIILHYPEVILKIGPLRNVWCMPFEAYHKVLKSTVKNISCYKNLLKTLTIKDSLRLSQRFLCKMGFTKTLEYNIIDLNLGFLSQWTFSKNAFCVSWIKIYDSFFKCDFVIQLSDEIDLLPEFGQIKYIILDENDVVYFIVEKLLTFGLLEHIRAYEVLIRKNPSRHLYSYNCLSNPYPFNVHFTGDGKTVIPCL